MRKSSYWLPAGTILLASVAVLGKMPQQPGSQEYSDQVESTRLRRLAAEGLRLPITSETEFRSEANFIGFRSKEVIFSRRTDSRTYFVQDLRREQEKEKVEELYRGSDAELLKRLSEVLRGLEIPTDEIVRPRVLQEQTQEGSVDHATGKMILEERRAGKRLATAARQIEGLPVFSSSVSLSLSADGSIGFLELHWPLIPSETLAEAHRLDYKLRDGWKPPDVEGARVESAEAGIVHSAAVGFLMDFHPTVRVIYAPHEKGYGRKTVRYLDRNGHEIPAPRQFAAPPGDPREKTPPARRPRRK